MPLVNNWNGHEWEGQQLAAMLAKPAARHRVVEALFDYVHSHHFSGVSIDFESLPEKHQAALETFMAELATRFHRAGLQVSMNVPANDRSVDYAKLAQSADALILMAYDEHWSSGPPGPISSLDWFTQVMRFREQDVPAAKIIVAIGNYAYDWPGGGVAAENTFEEAVLSAKESEADIRLDGASLNPTFEYVEEDGREHHVWLLDAVTAFDQLSVLEALHPRGIALWRLGSEDPSIWRFFGKHAPFDKTTAELLEAIQYGYDLDYEGKGEILEISATPEAGHREVTFDPALRLITEERFTNYPSPYVVTRYG